MTQAQFEILINSDSWKECFDESSDSYYKLIDLLLSVDRDCKKEEGFEIHHIIPRSYFQKKGIEIDNRESNLIKLLPSEHYMAHFYMSRCAKKIIKRSMVYALYLMTQTATKRKCEFSAEQFSVMYEEAKNNFIEIQKIDCALKHLSKEVRIAGFKKAMANRSQNEEYKKYLSARMKGNKIGEGKLKYSLDEINAITGLYNLGFTYKEMQRYFDVCSHTVKDQVEKAKKKYGAENVIDLVPRKQITRNEVYVYDKQKDIILLKTDAEKIEGVSDNTFIKKLKDENYRYCVIETMTIADIFDVIYTEYKENPAIINILKAEMERMKKINLSK